MATEKIFTTIGVYKNGEYKVNGVCVENIISHIDYNLTYRPGRAFIVDGKCLNRGYLTEEEITEVLQKHLNTVMVKDTQPYV